MSQLLGPESGSHQSGQLPTNLRRFARLLGTVVSPRRPSCASQWPRPELQARWSEAYQPAAGFRADIDSMAS